MHFLLRRDGWAVNPKRICSLYKGLGLQLRNKAPKRRVKANLRDDRRAATRSNETWAMDFVHDQLATGRKIRVLAIVDTYTRFSPAVERHPAIAHGTIQYGLQLRVRVLPLPQSVGVTLAI